MATNFHAAHVARKPAWPVYHSGYDFGRNNGNHHDGVRKYDRQSARETNALTQKLASTDLEKLLQTSLSDGSVCQYIVNNPAVLTFDSTNVSPTTPQVITPTLPIYASVQAGPPIVTGPVVAQIGQPASAYSSSAIIKTITLSISGAPSPPPPAGPGATFTGNWLVTLDPTKLVRAILPISVATTLTVDTTAPTAAMITGCQSGPPLPSGIICGQRSVFCNGTTAVYDITGQANSPCQGMTLTTTCAPYTGTYYNGYDTPTTVACPSGFTGGYEWVYSASGAFNFYQIRCMKN